MQQFKHKKRLFEDMENKWRHSMEEEAKMRHDKIYEDKKNKILNFEGIKQHERKYD